MKTLLCILCSIMLISSSSFANGIPTSKIVSATIKTSLATQEMFGYFRAHRQGKGVTLNWGMSSMAGIAYFKILHSDDGEYFKEIANVSPNGNRQSWKHAFVFPGYNHYRIVCVLIDGTEIYSETDTVRIVQRG